MRLCQACLETAKMNEGLKGCQLCDAWEKCEWWQKRAAVLLWAAIISTFSTLLAIFIIVAILAVRS